MHDRMFIVEAFEYHTEYKRWSRMCVNCIPEYEVPCLVERMIAAGYRLNIKPKCPDEFWK